MFCRQQFWLPHLPAFWDAHTNGSLQTVRDFIAAEIEATGPNYFVPWLAFGDMTVDEALHSVDLFAREVMPAFG